MFIVLLSVMLFTGCWKPKNKIFVNSPSYDYITTDTFKYYIEYKIYTKDGKTDDLSCVEVSIDSLKLDTAKIAAIYFKQTIRGQEGIPSFYSIIYKK